MIYSLKRHLLLAAIAASILPANLHGQIMDDSQITIQTPADVTNLRQSLINFMWGTSGFPSQELPSSRELNIASPVNNLSNLSRVDALHVTMDAGEVGLAHHFIPVNSNNRLVVLMLGHGCGNNGSSVFDDGPNNPNSNGDHGMQRSMNALLSAGFSVLTVFMPHYRPNDCYFPPNTNPPTLLGDEAVPSGYPSCEFSQPTPPPPPPTLPAVVTPHDCMFPGRFAIIGTPLKFFLEAIAASLNYLQTQASADRFPQYTDFSMVGLSGGGWTTTVYSAVDPRITISIQVSGSTPLYLRGGGDQEQNLADFYREAGYPDLYVLGGDGTGRAQIQILNRGDNCCFGQAQFDSTFSGSKSWDWEIRAYELNVRKTLYQLQSGYFALEIDNIAQTHEITDYSIQTIILPTLQGARPSAVLWWSPIQSLIQ